MFLPLIFRPAVAENWPASCADKVAIRRDYYKEQLCALRWIKVAVLLAIGA